MRTKESKKQEIQHTKRADMMRHRNILIWCRRLRICIVWPNHKLLNARLKWTTFCRITINMVKFVKQNGHHNSYRRSEGCPLNVLMPLHICNCSISIRCVFVYFYERFSLFDIAENYKRAINIYSLCVTPTTSHK